MYRRLKKIAALLIIAAMLTITTGSEVLARTETEQDKPDAGAMVADSVLLRPLGVVTLIAGFTFFVISSPFSALGGNIHTAWDKMVVDPARFTFARPLGAF
jgi:phosphatidylglycerophosphatase A